MPIVTMKEILDSMTDEQRRAMYYFVGTALVIGTLLPFNSERAYFLGGPDLQSDYDSMNDEQKKLVNIMVELAVKQHGGVGED